MFINGCEEKQNGTHAMIHPHAHTYGNVIDYRSPDPLIVPSAQTAHVSPHSAFAVPPIEHRTLCVTGKHPTDQVTCQPCLVSILHEASNVLSESME